jgi:hypothetical protein
MDFHFSLLTGIAEQANIIKKCRRSASKRLYLAHIWGQYEGAGHIYQIYDKICTNMQFLNLFGS